MSQTLLDKYNKPTPRYTSYPPATHFTSTYTAQHYLSDIQSSNTAQPQHLSFYIHVPFCPRLCHYCGCNAYPMSTRTMVDAYMEAILAEISLVTPHLDPHRRIAQIHYGGGTPTAIPLHWLARINEALCSRFALTPDAEIAIECHPGYLDVAGWQALVRAGFNRVSIGVQDTHDEVLSAVNRRPTRLPLAQIFELLRAQPMGINLDFIYGLPLQTVDGFADNIRTAIRLQPDRLVTFSYAHVPWVKAQQRVLEPLGLPTAECKAAMYARGASLLHDAGYQGIGLDHFVRPSDTLAQAAISGHLHRNFQGYCTRDTTGQVYAFGVTAISQLATAYAQNTRDVSDYITRVQAGHLPIMRGYALQPQTQLAGTIITALMCNGRLDWPSLAAHLHCSIDALRSTCYVDTDRLAEMAADGLLIQTETTLRVTDLGQPFLRCIAAAFDPLMRDAPTQGHFSTVI